MWKFKPFAHKEQTGLEGRVVDVGNLKIQVRNAIAEGGFSCVYLARDAVNGSKQYAVKHMICNDEESLDLVMKEISVLKSLRGHPNVVILHAHTIFDMGRTKEALLVMEFCDKSLVNVLESRGGAGYFEEKQILAMFRDICNAVFAMHCQSPPIAHRDLKAENLLLGSDGLWKLCDFGSTSTNHKRFDKPEDMGIEEDNIRKHTTPAYRAPEMWDLFRKDLINEKVDIWALGCLLFRICYLKSAFDGESKLQILNGNYRIPELPNYSSAITDLIRDMLQSSPEARPDITQVWFRVNGLLPDGLQKSLPDMPPEMHEQASETHEGIQKPANKTSPMPRRSPPPPPSSVKEPARDAPMGAFWATQHAKDSSLAPQSKEENRPVSKNVHGSPATRSENIAPKDFEINLFPGDSKPNESFNAFVADFDTSKLTPVSNPNKPGEKKEMLEAEVERLKQQLKQSKMEKAEVNAKYEKLSAICRSQRQEIQDLKQALSSKTPSPNRDASPNQSSPGVQFSTISPQREKVEGTAFEVQQGILNKNSPSPDAKSWQPFANDDIKAQAVSTDNIPKSVRTRGSGGDYSNKQGAEVTSTPSSTNTWGFETENFSAIPTGSSQVSPPLSGPNNSRGRVLTETKSASQPAGWAGF